MTFSFSTDQPLAGPITPSTNSIDFEANDAPSLSGQTVEVRVGEAGLLFNPPALLTLGVETSLDGEHWGTAPALMLGMSTEGIVAGQVLARRRLPTTQARYVRLSYVVEGGEPAGTISASLVPVTPNKFDYQPSGFEIL